MKPPAGGPVPAAFTFQASLSVLTRLCVLACLAVFGLTAVPAPSAAQAPLAHPHGVARLQVVVEGNAMTLRFESPLYDLVGFETPPRSERQRQAVRKMAARLHRPAELFVPPAEAACTAFVLALDSAVIAPELLAARDDANAGLGAAKPATRKAAKAADKGHADLLAVFAFDCAKPHSLAGLQVHLFEAFPELRQLDVEISTTKGQSGARLSPNRTGLNW